MVSQADITKIAADELRRIERAHVRAWPAFETAIIDGWLWRYSGGGSKRANSVSTIDFTGSDPAATLAEVEARYRAKGAPAQVHTFEASIPNNLADLLTARGYRDGETTITMFKRAGIATKPADIEVTDDAGSDWRDVYLDAITEDRRAINAKILDTIPRPRTFFACRRGGRIISTGLCVVDQELGVIECMATRSEARRQGGAAAILRGLESWAGEHGVRTLGLQAVAANIPAIELYRRLGFLAVDVNQFWVRN